MSHKPDGLGALIDLGDGHTFTPRYVGGELLGFNWTHPRPDGDRCMPLLGWIPIRPGRWWELVSLDPLTISPSLLCTNCQTHGFVREGKWVPA